MSQNRTHFFCAVVAHMVHIGGSYIHLLVLPLAKCTIGLCCLFYRSLKGSLLNGGEQFSCQNCSDVTTWSGRGWSVRLPAMISTQPGPTDHVPPPVKVSREHLNPQVHPGAQLRGPAVPCDLSFRLHAASARRRPLQHPSRHCEPY